MLIQKNSITRNIDEGKLAEYQEKGYEVVELSKEKPPEDPPKV